MADGAISEAAGLRAHVGVAALCSATVRSACCSNNASS